MHFRIQKIVLLTISICFSLSGRAETTEICTTDRVIEPIDLSHQMLFFEDVENAYSANEIIASNNLLMPASLFKPQHWHSTYWASVDVHNCSENTLELSLFFKNLTNIELFEYKHGAHTVNHLSGLFRSKKEITPGDDHDHFNLKI
jgi:hypothetical protein